MINVDGKEKSVYAFIFARGGSKGVPKKNIRLLSGKPLIAHAIDCAKKSNYIDRIIVSTDDENISDVSRQFGAEVPFIRPDALAQDNSPEWLAWQHAIQFMDPVPDIFVSVPATAPLRNVGDIDQCVEKLISGKSDIIITATEATRNPYFNMIKKIDDHVELGIVPETPITRRQDAPDFYDVTTVAYAAYTDFILKNNKIFDGVVDFVEIPQERALDIDTEFDFKLAEFLLEYTVSKSK